MDESVSPLASGLAWTVDLASPRDFVGKAALRCAPAARAARGPRPARRGRRPARAPRGPARRTAKARSPAARSAPRSASPSRSRACRRASTPGDVVRVAVRGKQLAARVVKPPFVRNGKVLVVELANVTVDSGLARRNSIRSHDMNVPADLKYAESHEWMRAEAGRHGDDRHHRSRAGGARRSRVHRAARSRAASLKRGRGLRRRRVGESRERRLCADRRRGRRGRMTTVDRRPETLNEDAYAAWLFRFKPADPDALSSCSTPRRTKS